MTVTVTAKASSVVTTIAAAPSSDSGATRHSSSWSTGAVGAGVLLGIMILVCASIPLIRCTRREYVARQRKIDPSGEDQCKRKLESPIDNEKIVFGATSTTESPAIVTAESAQRKKKEISRTEPAELEIVSPVSPLSDDASPVAEAAELQGCHAPWELAGDPRPQERHIERPRPPPGSGPSYRAAI